MGTFRVDVEIAKPGEPPEFRAAGRLIVDSGSEMTWVREETLQQIRVAVAKPAQRVVMANGEEVTRDVGYALIRAEGFETVDEVVFAEREDLQLLGARTLEGFNAVVDAKRRRLVAAGPIPAAES